MASNLFLRHSLFILFACIAFGFLSCYFGKDLCWDIAHYHYYVAYSYLNHRDKIDYWPTTYIHQFLNPTIDFLTYALINSFKPFTTTWLLGAINGINLWLLMLIARQFISGKYSVYISFSIALIGLIGPTTLPGIGSFQNDNVVALFVLAFVLLHLNAMSANAEKRNTLIFLSGLFLGLGLGLKLTTAPYVVGAFFSLFFLSLSTREFFRWLLLLSIGLSIGFLFFSGHWLIVMWGKYQNPFFPFFNQLFHSSHFPLENWRDMRFLPQGFLQTLFFPFYFSWDGRTADAPFQDFRFAVCYVLICLTLMSFIFRSTQKKARLTTNEKWLLVFFIISYINWQITFSIARYLAPLELLSPLLIYLLLSYLITDKTLLMTVMVTIFASILILLKPIPMVRAYRFNGTYFNVNLPLVTKQLENATVLMAYPALVKDSDPRPETYLVPFFNKEWQFVGVPFWDRKYMFKAGSDQKIKQLVSNTKNPIFLLTTNLDIKNLYHAAYQFGLKPNGKCDYITSDRQWITHLDVLLCPVVKRD